MYPQLREILRHYLPLVISGLLLVVMVKPINAQEGVIWEGAYFDNRFLSGDPVLLRQEAGIGFNWGTGSPAAEVPADHFSVRWAADPYFEAGTYRFYVQADDSVRLFVDFPVQPQIDTINDPVIGRVLTADVTLSAGVHHVQLDYRENTGNAYVYLSWANLASNPTGPNFPAPQPPPPAAPTGLWTAQYFPNTVLSGTPFLVRTENSPSGNWGAGSPGANIPADNWSARWTSIQYLSAGSYQITVRADDGVRVYVDGFAYIDEWHTATGNTYTAAVTLGVGQHTFQIEFYEAGGAAYIDFNLTPISFSPPVVQPSAAPTTGTVVTAFRLNVRSAPTTDAAVVTKINRGESYPVIGRNADNSWWLLDVNGIRGWSYFRFLDVVNPLVVPVVNADTGDSLDQPAPIGVTANTLATVNVRSAPGRDTAILGQIARNNQVAVVGRTATNTWWQVNYGQITGWVSSFYAPLESGTVVSSIPVTG